MNIRPATLNDCSEIARLHFASFKKAGEGKLPLDYLNELTVEKMLSRWQSRMSDKTLTLIAEEDNNLLGVLTAMNFDSSNAGKDKSLELRYFYVHVDHWRKGIGTKIAIAMAEMLIEAGYESVYGGVLKEDVRANAFYASLGAEAMSSKQIWIPVGTTPESYPGGTYAESIDYVVKDIKKSLLLCSHRVSIKDANQLCSDTKNTPQFEANSLPEVTPEKTFNSNEKVSIVSQSIFNQRNALEQPFWSKGGEPSNELIAEFNNRKVERGVTRLPIDGLEENSIHFNSL